jgi:hypothetical protein
MPQFKKIFSAVRWQNQLEILILAGSFILADNASAQSLRLPWSGFGHDAQHSAISATASQPLNRILWQTPVDLNPQLTGNPPGLRIHYGSPLITRSNTVILPVKTGITNGFEIKALVATNGAIKWVRTTDYLLPPLAAGVWLPSFSTTLTPKNRLYFPGGGGTVYYCDTPDTTNAAPVFGQIAFYGLANYTANSNAYLTNVFINTPITADRYGNIFFGFQVTGGNPLNLQSGLARIDFAGAGIWVAATNAAADPGVGKVAMNCAPALGNDHRTLYVAVNSTNNSYGYLIAVDSRTLAPLGKVRLKDVVNTNNDVLMSDNGTASPTVAPDGDVYYGQRENPPGSNHYRGWLLHFDSTLTQTKIPGAFGWDDTASIVPAAMVPRYTNGSAYLVMTKYNNYAISGAGDGVNKLAILDPQTSMTDPISGGTVMKEVLTMVGPTPDVGITNTFPNAVREWCINTVAVDPFTKSVLVNNEDGNLYRWDLTANTLTETVDMTAGIFEAYTPTVVGGDGIVYAINNAILFAIGR